MKNHSNPTSSLPQKRKIENKNTAAAATTSALTHKKKSDRNIQTRKQRNDPKFKSKQRLFQKEGDRETKESQTKTLRNKSPQPPSFPTTSHPKPFSEKAKPHEEKMKRQKAKQPDLGSGSFSSVSPQEEPDSGIQKKKESLSTTHKQSRQTAYL
jgi:hypothetical protein